jgi:hypothetical protein
MWLRRRLRAALTGRAACAILVGLACVVGLACATPPAWAQTREPAWHRFRSVAGRFQVLAPSEPRRYVDSHWTMAGRIVEIAYHFDCRGQRYGVTYHDLPRIASILFSDESLLDRVVSELMEVMDGIPLRSRSISLDGHAGRALAYAVRGQRGLVEQVRILLVGQRLYLIEAASRQQTDQPDPPRDDAVERFFDSFRLIAPGS